MIDLSITKPYIDAHPAPLLFATVSGAHLYGFESADSDYDLRGCHVTPVRQLVGLAPPDETHEVMDKAAPIEVDLVTHDVRKYFTLLLKNNGYVLEQVYSPIVAYAAPEFEELKHIARGCATRNHHYHFLRFGSNQWNMVVKGGKPTVKGLLYTYRVLLAGIHLMRTGLIESNLRTLNQGFRLTYIDDLIARKVGGDEKQLLAGQDLAFHEGEYQRLARVLEESRKTSPLPEHPTCRQELDDLLVRIRMSHLQ